MLRGTILLTTATLLISVAVFSQNVDYTKEFPSSWPAAIQYVAENDAMTSTMRKNGIDPALGWSIVFPELLRFDAIQDFFEVSALQTLYIQFGDSYADFSIGHFQMKPSFAMQLQKKWMNEQTKYFPFPMIVFDTTDTPAARKSIVTRLNSSDGPLLYLMLFVKIMDFRNWTFSDTEEKVKLYSAAYNSSFAYSRKSISVLAGQKNFHTGMTRSLSSELYSYSDISVFFWKSEGHFIK